MHPSLLKTVSKLVGNNLLSGMLTARIANMGIGTPCILDIDGMISNSSSGKELGKQILDVKPKEGYIDVINELISGNRSPCPSIVLFSERSGQHGYIVTPQGPQVYCFDKKPFILDSGKIVDVKTAGGIVTQRTAKNFGNKILDNLKETRYITYVISDMCASKLEGFKKNMALMFKGLIEELPHNACIHTQGNASLTIIDTIAVSFYRLPDVIPIFDSKYIEGFALEMFFTNSTTLNSIPEGRSYAVRWLFSKEEDNVFSIDGEAIKRRTYNNTGASLSDYVYKYIKNHLPNDLVFKKKAAKAGK